MDAIKMIKERRSAHRFKNQKVSRDIMKEIVSISRWAPSWGNVQVARYTLVDDEATIKRLVTDGVNGISYNVDILKNAKGVAVLSFVKGESDKLDEVGYDVSKANVCEVFDAGLSCQTFCLAAYEKGIGTCIMGVVEGKLISEIVNLPEEETVVALIAYGYEDGHAEPTPRKDVEEILRFFE